jgi:FemAB-related protein (PEP-CTERM system-associated)
LISLPFLDGGGILASCRAAEERLLFEVIRLGREVGAARIELRHEQPLSCWDEISTLCIETSGKPLETATKSHKVRMLLALPESSEMLMKSFKSKLRNQIKKPLKEGLTSRIGGLELLGDFYRVFLANMRDLGSPVHSVKLMRHVLTEFPEQSRVIVVYKEKEPVASSLVVGFNKVLGNPWASSLREYAPLSPNMLLYLRVLEYACNHGYQVFDFGRSSPGEGTYKFKEQWGAAPVPLHWHYISLDGKPLDPEGSEKGRFEKTHRLISCYAYHYAHRKNSTARGGSHHCQGNCVGNLRGRSRPEGTGSFPVGAEGALWSEPLLPCLFGKGSTHSDSSSSQGFIPR